MVVNNIAERPIPGFSFAVIDDKGDRFADGFVSSITVVGIGSLWVSFGTGWRKTELSLFLTYLFQDKKPTMTIKITTKIFTIIDIAKVHGFLFTICEFREVVSSTILVPEDK